jgi:hypothetical protein
LVFFIGKFPCFNLFFFVFRGEILAKAPVPVSPFARVINGLFGWGSGELFSEFPNLYADVLAEPLDCGVAVSLDVAGVLDVDLELVAHFVEQVAATFGVSRALFLKAVIYRGLLGLDSNKSKSS